MTSTTDTQTRQDRARFLLADNAQWLRLRSKVTGRIVGYAIPSAREPGLYWTTNGRTCNCPDFRIRGVECKHVRASRAYAAQVRISRQNVTA